jgi:hypothetical protein
MSGTPRKTGHAIGLVDPPNPWDGVNACREHLEWVEAADDDDPLKEDLLKMARHTLEHAIAFERKMKDAGARPTG